MKKAMLFLFALVVGKGEIRCPRLCQGRFAEQGIEYLGFSVID